MNSSSSLQKKLQQYLLQDINGIHMPTYSSNIEINDGSVYNTIQSVSRKSKTAIINNVDNVLNKTDYSHKSIPKPKSTVEKLLPGIEGAKQVLNATYKSKQRKCYEIISKLSDDNDALSKKIKELREAIKILLTVATKN